MKDYRNYKAEDFLNDERFRAWVISEGKQETAYWEKFKREFPDKTGELMLAKSLYLSLDHLQVLPEKKAKDRVWGQLERSIIESSLETSNSRSPFYRWWMAAAAILIIGGVAWSLRATFSGAPVEYGKQISQTMVPLHEKINTSQKEQIISLKDGSTVRLKSGSKLSYSDFASEERTVYLDGEGYFDIAKDPSKPFIVYAGHIVVQVVGTRFHVHSNTGNSKSNVAVTSGKVKVFAAGKSDDLGKDTESLAVYLSPNQQVVFDLNTSKFKTSLVENPVLLEGAQDAKQFYFTNTSIIGILNTLETAYGVSIRSENSKFESCKITAPLGDLPLFRKLDIICQTIGATYEVFGTEIVISGGDCNL